MFFELGWMLTFALGVLPAEEDWLALSERGRSADGGTVSHDNGGSDEDGSKENVEVEHCDG